MATTQFGDLQALFINCSIKKDKAQSHTQRLIDRAAGVMGAGAGDRTGRAPANV